MVRSAAFETAASAYDQWFDEHPAEYALELQAIRTVLPAAGRGVEIGAGTGRFTQPLGVALGIEPSQAMRDLARGRGIDMLAGTAESLPIDDDVYDYALLVTTVCFLDGPQVAFREAYRVLKPGGLIVVGLIDRASPLGKHYEARKNQSRFYKDATFHSTPEIQDALGEAGFHDILVVQALLPGDTDDGVATVKPGFGEGSFVVVRGQKPRP